MKLYGLIGKSLAHSFSKNYFEGKFERNGIDARYENFEFEKAADIRSRLEVMKDLPFSRARQHD